MVPLTSRAVSSAACARHANVIAALLLGLLLALLYPAAGRTATTISATTYNSNTAWTTGGSPYIVNGNVTVSAGVTLTIQAGVIVKFNGSARTIFVDGTISAVGTSSDRILFTSLADDTGGDNGGDGATVGSPGQWYSVIFRDDASGTFDYADVRYGAYGSTDWNYGALKVTDAATVTIDHSTFTDNERSGLLVGTGCSLCDPSYYPSATIDHSSFDGNANGISVNMGSIDLGSNSTASDNGTDGIWFNMTSSYDGPQSTVMNSEIADNGRYGVYLGVGSTFSPVTAPYFPRGNQNNIYNNGGVFDEQLLFNISGANPRTDLDWADNYWGDVYFLFNDPRCIAVYPNSFGKLAHSGAFPGPFGQPPDGPISAGYYTIPQPYPLPPIICAYDNLRIDSDAFSEDPIDNSGL